MADSTITTTPASQPDGQLRAENAALRQQLKDAEDTLRAIRNGEVDSIMIDTAVGPQLFKLQDLDAASNHFHSEILEQVGDAVIAVDADQRVTYLNAAAERQYGVNASGALGRHLGAVYTRQWPGTETDAGMWAALDRRGEWRGEIVHRTHDGRHIAVETSVTTLRGANGAPGGFVGVFRDVTARKRTEEMLRASEERYRRMVETAHEGIWTVDAQGRTTYVNQRMADLLGYAPAKLLGRLHADLMWEQDRSKGEVALDFCRQGVPQVWDQRYRRKDDSALWTLASCNGLFDAAGAFIGAQGMCTDITERKRTEDALQQSTAMMRAISDSTGDVIFAKDFNGAMTYANPATLALIGKPLAEVLAQTDAGFLGDKDAAHQVMANDRRVMDSGVAEQLEELVPLPDGTQRTWLSRKMPYCDGQGQVVGLLGLSRDITERKKAEQALRDIESRYRSLFENMLDGFAYCQMLHDAQGQPHDFVYLAVNDTFGRLTGLQNVVGKTATELDPGIREANPEVFETYGRVASTGNPERFEIDFKPLGLRLAISVYCPVPGYFVAVFDDITDRTRSEEALRASEQRFRIMADGLPQMVWVHDRQGQLQFVNRTYCTFFGVTPDQVAGPNWQPLMHADDVAAYVAEFSACVRDRRPFHAETRVRRFDGDWRWLESRAQPRCSAAGEFLGMVGSSADITERKQAEDALRESQQFTRSVLDNLFAFVAVLTADGTLTYANRAPVEAAGIPASELFGKKFWDCFCWSYSPAIQAQVRDACERAASGEVVRYDVPVRMAGDTRMWIDFQVAPLRDAQGRITHLIPSAMDVAVRRAAEENLRASEARTLLATEATGVGIWEWNALTNTIRWDAQMFRIYGIAPTPDGFVPYSDWSGALLPEDLAPTRRILQDAVRRGGQCRCEFRIHRRDDGAVRHIACVETVRANAHGEAEWMVGTNLDVTERKTAEIQLRRLATDLTDADRRKDEFLATLAHELRNPLAPIRNGLQLIKLADGQPVAVERARAMMERQLAQMVRLIDDLMDVSRISLGKLKLRKQHLSLASVLNSAVETIHPLIGDMGHELTVSIPKEPLIVDADMARLAQVFANLLSNAAKYSDRGGHIRLKVERQHSDVVVTVHDTGIGIAADQLPAVFDMFTQIDASLERSQGGLGIGLTLVKRLVELHGGSVEAHSDGPGLGSAFAVRLPVAIEGPDLPAPGADDTPAAAKPLLRILIVDDNRDAADSLSEMLKMMGLDTRTAYDGQEGLDMAGDYRPDVILLDIGLPRLNGYEACRQIRHQPTGHGVLLIAVTGWGQDEDRRRSHEAGFDHHMVKPVDPQALMGLIAALDKGHT